MLFYFVHVYLHLGVFESTAGKGSLYLSLISAIHRQPEEGAAESQRPEAVADTWVET